MAEQRAIIGSAIDGRVVEFPVNEGDRVEAGQKLAQLLTDTISLELAAAKAELKLRQEELEELKNGSRPEEIEQARAQMEAAGVEVRLGERRLERIQRLYRQGNAATEDQLDEAQAAADNARALFQERTAAYQLALAGPRKERILQAESRVAIQEAVVQRLEDQIAKHTVIARFPGYVVAERTEIGEWVSRGSPVAEIVGLDRVDVLANVIESHVPHIRPGSDARVEVPAIPDRVFTGKVDLVIPEGDDRSRTFPVKVKLENEFDDGKPLLNAGMLARVTLPTGPMRNVTLVPKDAIVLGGPSPMVYVVDPPASDEAPATVRPVPVTLGVSSGPLVEVIGDLKTGEKVVAVGNERLRPGQPVIIAREMEIPEPETRPSSASAAQASPSR